MSQLRIKRVFEFEGGGFTPHSLVSLPVDGLLCVLDSSGVMHIYDTLLGKLIKSTGTCIYMHICMWVTYRDV